MRGSYVTPVGAFGLFTRHEKRKMRERDMGKIKKHQ